MHKRNGLNDSELRRVVRSSVTSQMPAFMVERVMSRVREREQKRLRTEGRMLYFGIAAAIVVMLSVGIYALIRMRQSPLMLSPLEQSLFTSFAIGIALYKLHGLLRRRLGLDNNEAD